MLTDQLSLLPSTITTLAVPVPSLLATVPGKRWSVFICKISSIYISAYTNLWLLLVLPGGGNGPAVSAPLVALATQGGTIEVVQCCHQLIPSSFWSSSWTTLAREFSACFIFIHRGIWNTSEVKTNNHRKVFLYVYVFQRVFGGHIHQCEACFTGIEVTEDVSPSRWTTILKYGSSAMSTQNWAF